MRIVQALGWYYPDKIGGTEVYVAGLSRRLSAAGHQVFVAAPDQSNVAIRNYEHDGVPVFRYPIPANPTRAECQGRVQVRGAEHFHDWLASVRPDVVHFHVFVTGLGLPELKSAKNAGARVIVTTHSSSLGYICQRGTMMRWGRHLCDGIAQTAKCGACVLHQHGVPPPAAKMLAAISPKISRMATSLPQRMGTMLSMSDLIAHNMELQREMLHETDKFVVLTSRALEILIANGAPRQKLDLNPLGLSHNSTVAKPGPAIRPTNSPINIGYLGRFDPIKGVFDLARAIRSLPRDASFRLEFRGPVDNEVDRNVKRKLIEGLASDQRVVFAPPVPSADVPGILKSYDVLCCPSVCLEGGPTVAIEAHSAGTPVIGTRIGGLAELVQDGVNGRLVPPGDWHALSGVLAQMIADPQSTIDRWRSALPEARTMDAIAQAYLEIYRV